MTNEKLNALNAARDEMLTWQDIAERVERLKVPSFSGYGDGIGEPPQFAVPDCIFGPYKDKLTQWAQEELNRAKTKYASM